MVMAKTSIKTSPAVAATVAALTIAAVAGAAAPGAAAPVPASIGVIKSAAERSATVVRCGPGGWGDAAASLAAILPPGTLAVGGYYDSRSYGYSGSPPYYGDTYGAYRGCLDGYPVYYGYAPAYLYQSAGPRRSGHRYHRARPRAVGTSSTLR